MQTKIALIGAGSVVFTKTLLGDILQYPELSSSTICLMDIDSSRLKIAELMARKMIVQLKCQARVEVTLDQKEAIRNANYVICTIQVGGYKPATVTDFEIPRKYGLLQTIGDTLGVGGVFRALRTIPVMLTMAKDIADHAAKNCIFLNYTNPMAMNCLAVHRGVGIPHVGLCHSVQSTSQILARYAGLPYEEITYLVAGINHMAFFLKFECKRKDAYPRLFSLLDNPKFTADKVRFEMMKRTGYFVTESSEHQSEYTPYFIHHGKKIIKQFDIPIDEYLRRCEQIIQRWKNTEQELLGKNDEIEIRPQSAEYGSHIIHSRETNKQRVIYGNVPNRGLISNLPNECCVEVPCLVDANGIQPTVIGNLPLQLAAICRTNINVQELAVEAALTRKREHVYHAVMLDPHTSSVLTLDQIWAMCDDLIEAHQKNGFLGDFKRTSSKGKSNRRKTLFKVNPFNHSKNSSKEINAIM
jgi:alpha-galactosidase/6-phospho-beta-glucosidase family protein